MKILKRKYRQDDFSKIRDFFIDTFARRKSLIQWDFVRWNYARYFRTPMKRGFEGIKKWEEEITIWEDESGKIAGFIHTESEEPGEAYLEYLPEYPDILDELFHHAEDNLYLQDENKKKLKTYINDNNELWEKMAQTRGYVKLEEYPIYDAEFFIKDIPQYILPKGYKIRSMADENNIENRRKVLGLGFNHYDPSEWVEKEVYKELQKAPDYRNDLDLYVIAPDGEYIACCIIWYDKKNRIGILEPLATHPSYRRRGFGKAIVYEAIKRVALEGANKVLVGSGRIFYQSIGFKITHVFYPWVKEF